MPAMQGILHMVDRETPMELQRQLNLLADAGEPIVSLGPAPDWLAQRREVRALSRPLGVGQAVLWPRRPVRPEARVVHWWTDRHLSERLCPGAARIVLSLAALPAKPLPYHSRIQLTVPTPASARDLVRRGMPATHVGVLPPAAAPAACDGDARQRVRRELGLGEGDFLLLGMGDIVRPAGLQYASWAHAILRQLHDRVRLLIPGHGSYEAHLRYFVGTTGYAQETLFTGERFPLESCVAAADAGLFLADCDCGVGRLVQAMAGGLPIVASATPDIAWCAPDNEAALLVPPRSPRQAAAGVLRLMDDRPLALCLGQSARQRAGQWFTLQRAQEARRETYEARMLQLA